LAADQNDSNQAQFIKLCNNVERIKIKGASWILVPISIIAIPNASSFLTSQVFCQISILLVLGINHLWDQSRHQGSRTQKPFKYSRVRSNDQKA
jgi:hypothetical protein